MNKPGAYPGFLVRFGAKMKQEGTLTLNKVSGQIDE